MEVQWDISTNLSGFTKIFLTLFFLRNNNLRREGDFIFSTAMQVLQGKKNKVVIFSIGKQEKNHNPAPQ